MSRGQYSLFTTIFEKDKAQAVDDTRPRNYFMPVRNEHLLYRYYYHAEIKFMRYDKCLEVLEREFYLTEARMVVIMSEHADRLKAIAQEEKPDVKTLREKIPHFSW